jgi:predicted dehydrogenase
MQTIETPAPLQSEPRPSMQTRRLRFGVIGCGDVAHRRYLPALADLAEKVELRGVCDPRPEAAQRAADRARNVWPEVGAYTDVPTLVRDAGLDAAVVLTPAPTHGSVTQVCLDAGVNVYSEKPIASSVGDADGLIETAKTRNLLLLCAPGEAVSHRVRWLSEIVRSGRLGPLTLAVAHHADPGPAAWREYTGDPEVFYGPGVGPVFDHGVYRLHLMTTLLGPVRRVQAMGSIGTPTRVVRGGPRTGETIRVTAPDHVMINMEFASGALGQLLASFGTAATRAPWLELHFVKGSLSYGGASHERDAPASIYFDDDSPLALEGWIHGLQPPPPDDGLGVIEAGVNHFVACLRGEAAPVLTAEHARHVLEIILKAYESIDDGASHELKTTF